METDARIDALNRAYCYLRLNGMEPDHASRELAGLLEALVESSEEALHATWFAQVERILARAQGQWPTPAPPPALARTSIHYG